MSKANEARQRLGVTNCYWCRRQFTQRRKASYDHVHPKENGTRASHEKVLSCNACNWCRGDMPFDQYRTLSDAEHERSRRERRPYEPPKNADRPRKPKGLRGHHLELGERVIAHIRSENNQSPSKRRKFIIKVARAAQGTPPRELEASVPS